MAFFSPPDENVHPIKESRNLGIMLYDNFDIRTIVPLNTKTHEGKICRTFFDAVMQNGTIVVPEYDSGEVWKIDVQSVV